MLARRVIALAAVAALVYGYTAMAQAADNKPTTPANNAAQNNSMAPKMAEAARGSQPDVDLFLIPCLINANQAQVALGNIGEQRAQSADVKSFAQELVKEHTALENQASQLQDTLTKQMHPQSPHNTPVAAVLFEIHTQIAKAHLASAQQTLEKRSGADFDRVFIGMQVGTHKMLADTLNVFNEYAKSPQLKQDIAHSSEIAKRHLERAEYLWKEVEQQQPRQAQVRSQQR